MAAYTISSTLSKQASSLTSHDPALPRICLCLSGNALNGYCSAGLFSSKQCTRFQQVRPKIWQIRLESKLSKKYLQRLGQPHYIQTSHWSEAAQNLAAPFIGLSDECARHAFFMSVYATFSWIWNNENIFFNSLNKDFPSNRPPAQQVTYPCDSFSFPTLTLGLICIRSLLWQLVSGELISMKLAQDDTQALGLPDPGPNCDWLAPDTIALLIQQIVLQVACCDPAMHKSYHVSPA